MKKIKKYNDFLNENRLGSASMAGVCLIGAAGMSSCTNDTYDNPFLWLENGNYEMEFQQRGDTIKYQFDVAENITISRYKNGELKKKYTFSRDGLNSGIMIFDEETNKYDKMFLGGELQPDNKSIIFVYNVDGDSKEIILKQINKKGSD